ncbi:hypothetical protein NAEGRDRAFT_78004 [Naegleria gruberi]|uniref:Uncharacterized protein n=1 Tax=Naegleria gruberi TaxID=5762 RepID=D2V055_NAEGR|nr:uncharacterized protein NAEGRDRAFT_78004 [Naegleria gruberi]EFC49469.1 hypothetical protein NAEGRDRAFT_78004 [Naegleria gruberi]|eukprot:XP_002682213.1 hypothetical protein NAEGRDRAFT_78004 [Naegleria gruberi strain NEG-M]
MNNTPSASSSSNNNNNKRTYFDFLDEDFYHLFNDESIFEDSVFESGAFLNFTEHENIQRQIENQVVCPKKIRTVYDLTTSPTISPSEMVSSADRSEKRIIQRVEIEGLNENCWSNIVSFIGKEEFLWFKPYLINRDVYEKIFESESFWEAFFQSTWKGDEQVGKCYDWLYKRGYCLRKFHSFQTHNSLNIHILTGHSHDNVKYLSQVYSDMSSSCFITKSNSHNGQSFHIQCPNGWLSDVNWLVDIFLKEKPIHLFLKLEIKSFSSFLSRDLSVEAILPSATNQPIKIFGKDAIIKNGIRKLFKELNLDEEKNLPNDETELDLRFSNLKFGQLMQDRYFIWFCNSILSWIPFPIEDVYGVSDYSDHLCFSVNDARNEKIERYFELKKELGF